MFKLTFTDFNGNLPRNDNLRRNCVKYYREYEGVCLIDEFKKVMYRDYDCDVILTGEFLEALVFRYEHDMVMFLLRWS